MKVFHLAFVLCIVCFATASCFCQFDHGIVLGAVRDASGAAVPGVTVTLHRVNTGTATSITNNRAGDYDFNYVPAGDYTKAAAGSGFRDIAPVPLR